MTRPSPKGQVKKPRDMTPEEQRQLAEDFLKAEGAAFEMVCAREFQRAGLRIEPHGYFLDADPKHGGKVPREVDLRVRDFRSHSTGPNSTLLASMIGAIECKYAPTPWIGFEHGGTDEKELTLYKYRVYCKTWQATQGALPVGDLLPAARGFGKIHTSMKIVRQDGDSEARRERAAANAYEALAKALKVAAYEVKQTMALAFAFPIILLDGTLFSCRLDENDQPALTEVDRLMLSTSGFFPGLEEGEDVYCAVVTKKALPEFARNLAETFDLYHVAFRAHADDIGAAEALLKQQRSLDGSRGPPAE